jgi:hypothetical protein
MFAPSKEFDVDFGSGVSLTRTTREFPALGARAGRERARALAIALEIGRFVGLARGTPVAPSQRRS